MLKDWNAISPRYAANKACIRDVAGRFGLGETMTFRVIERVMEYLVELAKTEIAFPDDIRGLAKDFEQVRIGK